MGVQDVTARAGAQGGAMQTTDGLTRQQLDQYDELGFVRLDGFAEPELCQRMLDRIIELARAHTQSHRGLPGFVLPEANLAGRSGQPEELVAKIFGLHRDGVFADFARSVPVTDRLVDL